MPNPGDWGFYGSYFVIVRVIESIENLTNKTNNRRNNTYFRGALVNLQDNFSIEISDKLLASTFWAKDSCNDPVILGKFALGEVAYNNWFQNRIQQANTIANTKPGKKVIGNTMGNGMDSQKSKNKNDVPKKVNAVQDDENNDDLEMGETEAYTDEYEEVEDEELNETHCPITGKLL